MGWGGKSREASLGVTALAQAVNDGGLDQRNGFPGSMEASLETEALVHSLLPQPWMSWSTPDPALALRNPHPQPEAAPPISSVPGSRVHLRLPGMSPAGPSSHVLYPHRFK